jgi:hypothetical protein
MNRLDTLVVEHLEKRLLDPDRLEEILGGLLGRRERSVERRRAQVTDLKRAAAEADAKLPRLYEAIENGIADPADPNLKTRLSELAATREAARAEVNRLEAEENEVPRLTPDILRSFASGARRRLRDEDGTLRRHYVRVLAQPRPLSRASPWPATTCWRIPGGLNRLVSQWKSPTRPTASIATTRPILKLKRTTSVGPPRTGSRLPPSTSSSPRSTAACPTAGGIQITTRPRT